MTVTDAARSIVSPFITEMPREMAIASFDRPIRNRGTHAALAAGSVVSPRTRRALRDRKRLQRELRDSRLSALVDWSRDPIQLYAVSDEDKVELERCRLDRARLGELARTESSRYARFEKAGIVVPVSRALHLPFTRAAIEINRHCNYRCAFCPVSEDPLPRDRMSEALYRHVLGELSAHGISVTSLNHYNEPTLDRDLVERIRLADEFGLNVALNTNASLLDEKKIKAIAEIGNTNITVNLPTADAPRTRADRARRARSDTRVIRA